MINLKSKDGFRYGEYSNGSFVHGFPRQAMTTTNWNHLKIIKNPSLNMKTNILGIYCGKSLKDLRNQTIFDDEIDRIKGIMDKNPKKECFLILASENSINITKDDNEFLLKFQIAIGFHFIKVFFKKVIITNITNLK